MSSETTVWPKPSKPAWAPSPRYLLPDTSSWKLPGISQVSPATLCTLASSVGSLCSLLRASQLAHLPLQTTHRHSCLVWRQPPPLPLPTLQTSWKHIQDLPPLVSARIRGYKGGTPWSCPRSPAGGPCTLSIDPRTQATYGSLWVLHFLPRSQVRAHSWGQWARDRSEEAQGSSWKGWARSGQGLHVLSSSGSGDHLLQEPTTCHADLLFYGLQGHLGDGH